MKRFFSGFLALLMLCLSVSVIGVSDAIAVGAESEVLLTTNKTVYEFDEPIMVTATGSGKDWVGVYYPTGTASLYWAYVDKSASAGIGSGISFDIRKAPKKNGSAPATLPAGDYIIRLMPNDSSDLSKALASINITIKPREDSEHGSTSGGDLSRLNVPKTEYKFNEQIIISATGSGKDWVGIYYPDAPHSLYWTYIDKSASSGVGSGVEFDIKNAANKKGTAPSPLPAGDYIIRLMPNDSEDIADTVAWVKVTIKALDPSDTENLAAPLSAEYVLKNATDGYSEGTLTVKVAKDSPATDIVCFWANASGALEEYTPLAKFKVSGETTVRELPPRTLIPTGATKLLVYTSLSGVLSKECFEIALPEGAASDELGRPIVEFQVVSDIHITSDVNYRNSKHYLAMLRDIVAQSPDSLGLFINGDIANSGSALEYQIHKKLHSSVSGAPNYYMAIGNHDLYNGSLADKTALFLSHASLPDVSSPESVHYDFWLGGYHYVFLGNDKLVDNVRVTLTDATLSWLDATLAEDRDAGRPTFLFLHQSIYDTVSGSLPGQGWDGVISPEKLKAVLSKYPEVIMFNGHSHWTLDSERCMSVGSESMPTIFNTASVAYLWTSYDVVKGENLEGSEGYYIRVYEDKVAVLGRDFVNGKWISSAQFIVELASTPSVDTDNGEGTSVTEAAPVQSTDASPTDTAPTDDGCGSAISSLLAICALLGTAALLRKKN